MLSVLVVSKDGEGYGLANKLAKEKNFVKFYTEAETGRGYKLPKRVDHIDAEENQDAVICFLGEDGEFSGTDRVASMGKPAIGFGGLCTKLKDEDFHEKLLGLTKFGPHDGTGYEYDMYRFFNGSTYLPFTIVAVQDRRIGEGDRGLECESAGCTVKVVMGEQDNAFKDLERFLAKAKFVGLIGFRYVSGIQTHILTRLNCGMLYAFCELCYFPFTELLMSVLYDLPFTGKFRSGVGVSVLTSLPPYPFPFPTVVPLGSFVLQDDDYMKHFVVEDVWVDVEGRKWTGSHGIVGWSTAFGTNVREARRRAYRTLRNAVINKNLQWRSDVGERAEGIFQYLNGEAKDAVADREGKESDIEEHRGVGEQLQTDG